MTDHNFIALAIFTIAIGVIFVVKLNLLENKISELNKKLNVPKGE